MSVCLPYYSGFRRKARVLKCKSLLVAEKQNGGLVPGVPCVNRGNWRRECHNLCYQVLAFLKQHNLQNAAFYENSFAKIPCLIRLSHVQNDVERFRNGPVHELYSLKS